MFKTIKKNNKNFLCCNELIVNAMVKRRRLASAAILNVCDVKEKLRVVK